MEFLLIESDSSRRVIMAKHLCGFGHRVTLASSIDEARELLSFIRKKAAAPSAVLIAENLLGKESAAFREELLDRFSDLRWVPVRADIDVDWLRRWLEGGVSFSNNSPHRRAVRRCLNILFVEEDRELREEVTRRLSAVGDRVISCCSIAQARQESDAGKHLDVLIAPTVVGGAEAISRFIAAKNKRPNLRWIVQSEAPTRRPTRTGTLSEIDRLRRSASENASPNEQVGQV